MSKLLWIAAGITTRAAAGVVLLVAAACSHARAPAGATPDAPAGAPEIPSPVYRTPTITLPPPVVERPVASRTEHDSTAHPTLPRRLSELSDSLLRDPGHAGATHAILILDAATGETILERNPGKLLIPASNAKLITAVAALETLGAEFTWETPVLIDGTIAGDVLHGDLLIAGSGDPTWSDSMQVANGGASGVFAPVARALEARGIKRIDGSIRAIGDAFPGNTLGKGWEEDDLDAAYGAAVDELLYNNGYFTLRVTGGRTSGTPLSATTSPVRDYPPVEIQGTTGSAELNGPLRARYDSTAATVIVTGAIPPGRSALFNLAYRHPNDAARAALSQYLRDNGLSFVSDQRTAALTETSTQTQSDTLVVLRSLPLGEVLRHMLQPSQNQIAEAIFRTIGLRVTGNGSSDSAGVAVSRTIAALGIDSTQFVIADGSGLSRHNLATPSALAHLLATVATQAYAKEFLGALPVAGASGTLRSRMTSPPLRSNVAAKSGSMSRVRALSGYVTGADGRKFVFSFISNSYLLPPVAVDSIHEQILAALSSGG